MSELFLCQSIVPRLAIPCLQARSLKEAFLEWRATAQACRARHHAGRQLVSPTARGLTQRLFTFWLAVHRARACFRRALLRRALRSWADRTVYKRHQVGSWTLPTLCLAGCILWAWLLFSSRRYVDVPDRITCWQQVETQKHSWVARPACSDQTPPSVHLRHCSAVPAQGQRLGQAMQVLMWGSLARCFLAWRDDTQVRRTALF